MLRSYYLIALSLIKKLDDLILFFIRVLLAYGFYMPALNKVTNLEGTIAWFEKMGLVAPVFQAYLATGTEVLGVILLPIGLASRIISIPLIITMVVAIVTVHWTNGFAAGDNGFEIPLYYIVLLMVILIIGPGKWSLDHLLYKKNNL